MISSTYALPPKRQNSLGSIWEAAGAVSAAQMRTRQRAECVHPKAAQKPLGHSQLSMALDVYSHVALSLQCEAAGRIDQLLNRGLLSRQ